MTAGGGRRIHALAALLTAAVLAVGCGGDDGGSDEESGQATAPVARPSDFPAAAGKTLQQLRSELGPGPVLSPAVGLVEAGGEHRFAFGLFDRSRKQIGDAKAAVYISDTQGQGLRGPYPARFESLAVDEPFQSESVSSDPDAAESVYVVDLPFEEPGDYAVLGAVELDGRLVAADPVGVRVVRDANTPEPGERAPRVSTPTVDDVDEIAEIDTRVPPAPELHEDDFAEVVGKKPAVILLATPALCQSRVCGPVVDIMLQVRSKFEGQDIAWIHQEIFKDNEFDKGYREEVVAWRVPSEPWLFTVDASGKVAARIEGAFSARELEQAVQAAVDGAPR